MVAVTTLLYGSESWAPKGKNFRQMVSSELGFLNCYGCVTKRDRIQNTTITQVLNIQSAATLQPGTYTGRWKEHTSKIQNERIQKQTIKISRSEKRGKSDD